MLKFTISPILLSALFLLSVLTPGMLITTHSNASAQDFVVEETTIAQIHDAVRSGKITFKWLTEYYLKRIAFYDQPTNLNSIVVINPNAVKRAEELDNEFQRTGKMRPLHGIPVIVKDNYDTKDLQTAGGSIALSGSIPPDDAHQVRVLREAGAIVLVKSNMAEWAFSPYRSISSIAGTTRNPYDLERVPAGSSGGTAAAVAANLGAVGLGTDTGNSIRGPSSHTSLVGIRSTIGATSRDGIIPLYLRNDIGGPMTRTVEDAARILEVIAGYDPADPITKMSAGKIPDNYTQFLDKNGLQGARIGVFRKLIDTETADPQVKALMEKAIEDLKRLGAVIVDPFEIPSYDELNRNLWCDVFRYDVNNYLASLGENASYKSIEAIVEAGLYDPGSQSRLQRALREGTDKAPEDREPPCLDVYSDAGRTAFREAVIAAMDKHNINAFIYPSWNNPPRKIGDSESPHGNNSQSIPPATGQPALTVPMGFTYNDLPAGLQIVGRMFGESDLIKYAYAYEQGTKHRRAPKKFPKIK